MSKRKELMNKAIQLFSEKGFHQTSVQEIAQAAGISKGAFYKHFDTKEQVFIEILKTHYENMIKHSNAMNDIKGISKKEVFTKKLSNELEQWIANREFFTVLFKDFPPNKNEQVSTIMKKLKSSMIDLHKETLIDTYGNKIEPYMMDIVIMLEGILKEYVVTIILKKKNVDVTKLARLITSSMDGIVQSLPQVEPVFTDKLYDVNPDHLQERLNNCCAKIEEKVVNSSTLEMDKEKLLNSIKLMKEEMAKDEPKSFLIDALLNYLRQETFLKEDVQLLERLYLAFPHE
ncbi:TetR/AcrR family transcriptional regulator [Salinibacillus xinjiangensis]|uniref:TetR family transcriptional regulator n=1 Tax=Salinibacillus xinjiangensis TaxID=1229268 RepID=A0A6G1X895_9BACI|nr:helix-turn-helix domain-containing protein [Salinibacillus xinjiangensis]MRG87162.1 TetR family transcriptional regulator [Salinibacillus xinjiangensis]